MGTFTDQSEPTNNAAEPIAPTNETFVNQLVKAKGDNFLDPEVVAKSKLEADAFITNLENQNAELREDLGKHNYAKDLLEQLQDKTTHVANVKPEPTSIDPSNTSSDSSTKLLESGDLESLISDTLTKREAQVKTDANLLAVDSKLKELFGTEADKTVEAKAQELGLSMEHLKTMAAESPQAFFALIGERVEKIVNPVAQSTVNTGGVYNHVSDRDYGFYTKMRKENPRDYYSPKVQQAMVVDAQRLGDKFYS